MADKTSTVELVFQGIDKTSEATQAALRNAEKFSRGVGNVTAPIADFTKGAVALESLLLSVGTAITTFSVKAAGDFDEAFREIATLIDKPIEDLGEFKQEILDYSKSSTQPLTEITDAVYSAISSGVDYADSLKVVSQSEKLAVGGKAQLSEALQLLVSSLNAYGEGMGKAEQYSDDLFTTVKNGKTTVSELAGALSRVTPLAANSGVGFDELVSAIAAITSTGATTESAITQVRGALTSIINPTSEASELAKELGVEFNATALESGGLQGVLNDVARATGGNVEQMGLLFGNVEGLSGALTLTGDGADEFSQNLDAMANNAGATDEAFDTMADGITQSNQQIKNAIENILIEIGQPLLDEYQNIANALVAIFNAIGQDISDGQLGGLVNYLESVADDIYQALANIAQNLPEALSLADLSGFQSGIENVIDSVSGLFDGFDLGTPQGLASAIEALGQAFSTLSNFTAGAVDSLQWIFDALADGGGDVLDFAEGWAQTAGEFSGFVTQLNAVMPSVEKLIQILGGLAGIIAVKQTGSLVAAIARSSGSFKKFARLLGPAGAIAASTLFLVDRLKTIVDGMEDIREANQRAEQAQDAYGLSAAKVRGTLSGLSQRLGISIEDMDQFHRLVQDGTIVFDESTGRWERGGKALEDAGKKAGEAAGEIEKTGVSAGKASEILSREIDKAGGSLDDLLIAIEDGETVSYDFGEATKEAYESAAAAAEEATQESEGYRAKLNQIASDERIKTIEAKFDFEAEALVQEAKRVEAAFGSINTTVNSTGDLIDSLTGKLLNTRFEEEFEFVQDLIQREEKRRDDALKLQEELTRAQIEALEARTDALASGQALINVDGAGLQPHLEAFMWEILREIQVRVNQDGFEMLLGSTGSAT
ncbi:MAG: phage tail tape measure protein [Wenzhouxiangella sp.]|jgi:TP901 family phage tail tape measure protein|nr:phage tail tape measure protein [Wenzhouxiangella sp.]